MIQTDDQFKNTKFQVASKKAQIDHLRTKIAVLR